MGTELPPNEPGPVCSICWGPGKPFGPGPTPRVVQMRLTRLLPGEHWDPDLDQLLLTTHWLEPDFLACAWFLDDGIFDWSYQLLPDRTGASVTRRSNSKQAFQYASPPICQVDFPNNITDPTDVIAYHGFANITWNPEDL